MSYVDMLTAESFRSGYNNSRSNNNDKCAYRSSFFTVLKLRNTVATCCDEDEDDNKLQKSNGLKRNKRCWGVGMERAKPNRSGVGDEDDTKDEEAANLEGNQNCAESSV